MLATAHPLRRVCSPRGACRGRWFSVSSSILAKTSAVPVSWNIGVNDLNGQKRTAINSVLSKGNQLQLQLADKKGSGKRRKPLTDLDIQRRTLLVDKCKALCTSCGGIEASEPKGNIYSVLTLFYKPG